jgi:short-subunit dehydrogenase
MKRAIIIGASSGIGKGLAKLLAENDYKVGITGRKIELLNEVKKTNSKSFLIKTFDVTDIKVSIEKLEDLTSELGGLDLLILSSGTGDLNETLDFEIEKKAIDLNVTGFTNIIDWTYRYFEKQEFGHLVAISSLAGIRGSRQAPAYNATKSYQINYLEGLRQKSTKSKKSIFITDIRPGLVDIDMAKGEGLFWVMPVKKVTKQIFKGIKNKSKVVYVTKRWGFIGRLLKILPRFIYDRM